MINSKVQAKTNAIDISEIETRNTIDKLRRQYQVSQMRDRAVRERAITETVSWVLLRIVLFFMVSGFVFAGMRFAIVQSRLLIQEVFEVRADG